MRKEYNNNSRNDFIKKMSLGLVSLLGLGAGGIKLFKSEEPQHRLPLLTDTEAGEFIRKVNLSEGKKIKPSPPPTKGAKGEDDNLMKGVGI